MTDRSLFDTLESLGVIPVVEIDDADDAVPLARTLVEAGLPILELTLRTEAGLESIRRITTAVPACIVGAGTLLSPDQVIAAVDAGAVFGVSPGLSLECLNAAADHALPFVPGAVTPTELMTALDAGIRRVKFFPAGAYGGQDALRALAGPFTSKGVKFMPTGGVTVGNAGEYLSMPTVFAVGGTWVAPRADIAARRWDEISRRATAAAAVRATATEDVT